MSSEETKDLDLNSKSETAGDSFIEEKECFSESERECDLSGIVNKAFESDDADFHEAQNERGIKSPSHLGTDGIENHDSENTSPDVIEIKVLDKQRTPVVSNETKNDCEDTKTRDLDLGGNGKEGVVSETPDFKLQKAKKVKTSLKKWVTGTNFIVYISHALSAWGDRMWSFGVGLFLVNIASENLQLPAIFGLASSLTIFFFGATVGDWVDSTPRLKAAQLSLILQNAFVVVCAAGVYVYLWFQVEITTGASQEWLVPLCHAGIIVVAIFANVSSMARMIAVERDWIVEICGKDKDMLAKMTASLRRIDQGTLILAPIATGQIMTYAGLRFGAIFIAAWNVGSVFIEYYLIRKVYNTVPALRAKKGLSRSQKTTAIEAEEEINADKEAETPNDALTPKDSEALTSDINTTGDAEPDAEPAEAENASEKKEAAEPQVVHEETESEKLDPDAHAETVEESQKKTKENCCHRVRIFSGFLTLYRGWRTYMGYSVQLAGLALSCLYMTVLGFDNITVAYAVTQGVSESILGILMGVSALFGIMGTFAYPALRRRIGLVRTGIFALSFQVMCLTLCVASIWVPGSPFDPLYYIRSEQPRLCDNSTGPLPTLLPPGNASTGAYNLSTSPTQPILDGVGGGNLTDCKVPDDDGPDSYVSVGLLMAGIVTARFGLWTADLTITQLFLEEVVEGERGIVNGVQNSLNKLMDVLKFVLVVAIPDIPTFGYLIVLSFGFICLGWLLYAIFLRRNRGHFFHFEKCRHHENGHPVSQAA